MQDLSFGGELVDELRVGVFPEVFLVELLERVLEETARDLVRILVKVSNLELDVLFPSVVAVDVLERFMIQLLDRHLD